jgi:hypothetical protein
MEIENMLSAKDRYMKKILEIFIKRPIKKIKEHKQIKKLMFSNYKEDFVITEQEEREGGFFGSLDFKPVSA